LSDADGVGLFVIFVPELKGVHSDVSYHFNKLIDE